MATKTGRRGGLVPLLVIATAQLMLVLDDSIVNIALPSIQRELGRNGCVVRMLPPLNVTADVVESACRILVNAIEALMRRTQEAE